MEQHSLHTEPTEPASMDTHIPDTDHITESRESTPVPTSQHEHSDSMVTIRLSKTDVPEIPHDDIKVDTGVGGGRLVEPVSQDTQNTTKEEDREVGSEHSSEEEATITAGSPTLDDDLVDSPTDDSSLMVPSTSGSEFELDARASREVSAMDIMRQSASLGSEIERAVTRNRSMSSSSANSSSSAKSSGSTGSGNVNWTELDKTEEIQERDHNTDESTAFLLARLEQENNALAHDPKAQTARVRSESRPPSYQQLKKLVSEPQNSNLRYSMLPAPPPMTELEFWTALVRNYPQTAQRLPTLTANKLRSGIPPPLRGVVWQSISGSRESALEAEYDRLCLETSPHERIIAKDIGRSFPGVDMFRDPDGEGQKMLGKVLNAFSMYDSEIGYCQGLGFVVGPLIMHMGEKEAFCTLVRLMMQYDLRSCYLPDLSGLHLRIYQFQHLLSEHLPQVTEHLDKLGIEPLYLSQWFLSFFGTTCPLPMLIRIYDVILTEGASETLLRVGLSLMRRNEKKILAAVELEDAMQLLIARSLWDTYGCNADDLVQDFYEFPGLVTREKLDLLEERFRTNSSPTSTSKPNVHNSAARFLGRLWTGTSGLISSPKSPSAASLTAPGRPTSTMRRSASKQSLASTLNSIEGSDASTTTEATDMSRQPSGDWVPQKPSESVTTKPTQSKDKGLHSQIEDLLTALSDLQREHAQLASDLQREREDREEDRSIVKKVVEKIKESKSLDTISESGGESEENTEQTISLTELEQRFIPTSKRNSMTDHSKQYFHDEAQRWKTLYNQEVLKSADLTRQLQDQEQATTSSNEALKQARSRIQSTDRDKQRLEKANQELRTRSRRDTVTDADTPADNTPSSTPGNVSGLREFKLGRSSTTAPRVESTPQPNSTPQFSKRMSSLSTQSVLATENNKPASEEALLLELVASKTAEAVAKQELEEVKAKLDSLRKLLGGNGVSPGDKLNTGSVGSSTGAPSSKKEAATPGIGAAAAMNAAGGFFSGWGKRAASSTTN